LRLKIDWASLLVGSKFTVSALYLRTISKYKHQGGFYLEGRFNGGFFTLRVYGGLYLEGLIFGIYGMTQNKQPQTSELKGPWFSLAQFPNCLSNVHDMRYYERRALFATDET